MSSATIELLYLLQRRRDCQQTFNVRKILPSYGGDNAVLGRALHIGEDLRYKVTSLLDKSQTMRLCQVRATWLIR
jgi:hypothetical protein